MTPVLKGKCGITEIAQEVRVLAIVPDDWSWIPGTHIVEREN